MPGSGTDSAPRLRSYAMRAPRKCPPRPHLATLRAAPSRRMPNQLDDVALRGRVPSSLTMVVVALEYSATRGADRADGAYCVLTATLVAPRVTSPASVKRTKTRFAPGSKGTVPLPVTNTANVGVCLGLICTVTVGLGGDRHDPAASVLQTARDTGMRASPVSALTVMGPPAPPTFAVATAKAPVPSAPGRFTIPSPVNVATNAMMSGTASVSADRRKVFTPWMMGAGGVLAQWKVSSTL